MAESGSAREPREELGTFALSGSDMRLFAFSGSRTGAGESEKRPALFSN